MLEVHDVTCGLSCCSRLRHVFRCRGVGGAVAVVDTSPDAAGRADNTDLARAVLASLVHERQALRHAGTDRAALEANRLAIVYWQQELSKRLIESGVR